MRRNTKFTTSPRVLGALFTIKVLEKLVPVCMTEKISIQVGLEMSRWFCGPKRGFTNLQYLRSRYNSDPDPYR